MSEAPRIVALALLSQSDLDRLGTGFRRWYALSDTPSFGELLRAIDRADQTLARDDVDGATVDKAPRDGRR